MEAAGIELDLDKYLLAMKDNKNQLVKINGKKQQIVVGCLRLVGDDPRMIGFVLKEKQPALL